MSTISSPGIGSGIDVQTIVSQLVELERAPLTQLKKAATSLQIQRPRHSWAGLRSFVADGDLVVGWDAQRPGFIWLAAQGGYGIQSAAGVSQLACALLLDQPVPEELLRQGVDPHRLAPARLR